MRRFPYLTLLILSMAVAAQAQRSDIPLNTPLVKPSSVDHSDPLHNHQLCKTLDLLNSEEGKRDMEAFRAFQAKRKPWNGEVINNYQEGQTETFNVSNFETNRPDQVTFTLRKKGVLGNIWVANDQYGPGKVTAELVDLIYERLEYETPDGSVNPDTGIVAINQEIFGRPPNVDGSGVMQVLLVDVQDGWDPETGGGFVGGFFSPSDLNPNSSTGNFADIIYIDTYPTLYLDSGPRSLDFGIGVLAHEYQHLIHGAYGGLPSFMNEAQSEYASVITGTFTRYPGYLSSDEARKRYLLNWNSDDAIPDYQRGSVFHSYIGELLGPETTGSITRGGGSVNAYRGLFGINGLDFSEVLLDFHTINWINGILPEFSYQDERRGGVQAFNPSVQYEAGNTDVNDSRELRFGAVEYIEFIGVENMTISLNGNNAVRFSIVTSDITDGSYEVIKVDQNSNQVTLNGEYKYVILVAANTDGETNSSDRATYSYDASWTGIPVLREEYGYFRDVEFYTDLPGRRDDPAREGRLAFAIKYTPEFDGEITTITFPINNRETGIRDDGILNLVFSNAATAPNGTSIPGTAVDTFSVGFGDLTLGTNSISIPGGRWEVEGDQDYFVEMWPTGLSTDTAGIEMLLDGGTETHTDAAYDTTRTFIYVAPPTSATAGWYQYSNRNNLVVSAEVFGVYNGPLVEPAFSSSTSESIELAETEALRLSLTVTGTPEPRVQWYKDGQLIPGATSATYEKSRATLFDSGSYTAEVSNFAGTVTAGPFTVNVVPLEFVLEPNFPNPFNPSTNIRFTIDSRSEVRLSVYDILGREVQVIVNERLDGGRYEFTFDAGGLASGIYLLRLQADGNATSRKISFIK